jgi:hypothetical protein
MKRYWDLSEYQRACLTEEELQRLQTVECMENGVVLRDIAALSRTAAQAFFNDGRDNG